MNDFIEKRVTEWALSDSDIREVNFRIIHLEKRLFNGYVPCKYNDSDFFIRLKNWLGNITDTNDQKALFEIIPNFFYVGDEEINSLYRSAYNIEIARWLINVVPINFRDTNNEAILNQAVIDTWFCPITDSFSINDFFKINNIPSRFDLRPDWHSLTELADPGAISKYVTNNNIKRIVMLEDFVGSGSQVASRVTFACSCLPKVEILCISLITCPVGVTTLNALVNKFGNLTVKHIVEIPAEYLINKAISIDEPIIYTKIRELADRSYLTVTNGISPGPKKPYYPLGYKETGGLIILNTNVPDNSLPLIHHTSNTWAPLFKRITRV
ncbi:hypothetical protein MuYL_0613 [Mucilaginibacter xinganensis]|uniref:PRTase-CE domain-containing protein n=2 Tax=Mucilaginibacter xinganensis TaxID=1234841 RepID=A0A223NRS9_9SPHI|nr:hypothetical protein MuYL_0613 [Mucilaginibacter xinganensis]